MSHCPFILLIITDPFPKMILSRMQRIYIHQVSLSRCVFYKSSLKKKWWTWWTWCTWLINLFTETLLLHAFLLHSFFLYLPIHCRWKTLEEHFRKKKISFLFFFLFFFFLFLFFLFLFFFKFVIVNFQFCVTFVLF